MKIELKQVVIVGGVARAAGSIIDISESTADWLMRKEAAAAVGQNDKEQSTANDDLTIAELKAQLDARGVLYRKNANKAELSALFTADQPNKKEPQ